MLAIIIFTAQLFLPLHFRLVLKVVLIMLWVMRSTMQAAAADLAEDSVADHRAAAEVPAAELSKPMKQ